MNSALPIMPPAVDFLFLIGLSFFLGLAYEEVQEHVGVRRPGGIRTFPLLSAIGGTLYILDPARLVPFTGGLLILGAWLFVYYRERIGEKDEEGYPNVGLVVPLFNVYAYVLGAIVLVLPHWIAVGMTVGAVLLFAGRSRLHDFAQQIDTKEIITACQFLILTGLVLPLLPNAPVTSLTAITPQQAWLALLVVCALSYISYLVQRYWPPAAEGLWMAALGGVYSSTATTVVLARQAKADDAKRKQAQAGITLATGIMYIRIFAIVAVFNFELARKLAIPLFSLAFLALLICVIQFWSNRSATKLKHLPLGQNPLELGAASIFATLFILTSLLSTWATVHFGSAGMYSLAAIVGFTDIDPFVLNLAQGGTLSVPISTISTAILIAASSNNILKACYAAAFGGMRATAQSLAALVFLAAAGILFTLGLLYLA